MADAVSTLLQEIVAFAEGRVEALIASTFPNAVALATALRAGAQPADLQTKLDAVIADLNAGQPAVKPVSDAVAAKAADAAQAATRLKNDLAAPFSLAVAGQAAAEIATIAQDLDAAIAIIAGHVAHLDDPNPAVHEPDTNDAIMAILEPWRAPLKTLGAGVGASFDALSTQLLGAGGASGRLAAQAALDRAKQELSFPLSAGGERAPVVGFPGFTLANVAVTPFIDFGASPAIGIRVAAILNTGLAVDGLLQQIVPGSAPKAASSPITIQLDSAKGLSLGSGQSPHLMLGVHFDFAGIELRDVGLAVSSTPGDATLELTTTVAGKLGGVMDVVVEGGGVVIGLVPSPAPGTLPVTIGARAPDGAGVSVNAGIVSGGGYLYHKGNEYGGALALHLAAIGVTAIGFVGTNPFSLVLVIGVEFFPAIELGLGFTLDGVGGLLALERRVASDALRQVIVGGAADAILFPRDPVADAPQILAKLHDIFPAQPGGFVVGPIAELGWGSQAKFVVAKLGVVISLPDPKVIILGALRVAVPSAELPPDLCIIDLNAGLYGEITPEHLLLVIGLTNSRVANITISGDVGLLIAWGGSPDIVISVGGFHPHFTPPAALAGLRRIAIDMSPAVFVTLHAEGYLAITTNTLQFGALVRLEADLGFASGEAWIGLDALFRWSPRLFFEIDVTAGISIRAFGHSFANVSFTGHLEGMTPWKLQGTATVDVWFLPTINFDIGPFTWNDRPPEPLPAVSPQQIVADALQPVEAWAAKLPSGADMLVQFAPDDATLLLVHPLGAIEVHQIKVPLETPIDRVGKSPVTAHQVNLMSPMVGDAVAGAVSNVPEMFSPGEFLNLTDDQSLSRPSFEERPGGARFAATGTPVFGPGVDTTYEWETVFPHEPTLSRRRYAQNFVGVESAMLRSGAVGRAGRARSNAYTVVPAPIAMENPAQREIRRGDDLSVIPGVTTRAPSVIAEHAFAEAASGESEALVLIGAGVGS